jgi:hypothetical protein
METAEKLLLAAAAVLAVAGAALYGLSRLGVHDLPGTLRWRSRGGRMQVVAPVGLMIAVSVVATIVLNVLFRR